FFFFSFFSYPSRHLPHLHSFPTRRSSDLGLIVFIVFSRLLASLAFEVSPLDVAALAAATFAVGAVATLSTWIPARRASRADPARSEEHTSELQSRGHLVCRLLLEKKKKNT